MNVNSKKAYIFDQNHVFFVFKYFFKIWLSKAIDVFFGVEPIVSKLKVLKQ